MARAPMPLAALADGTDGAAPGQFGLEAEPFQLAAAVARDIVGEPGRAVDGQQMLQLVQQIFGVDLAVDVMQRPSGAGLASAARATGETAGR